LERRFVLFSGYYYYYYYSVLPYAHPFVDLFYLVTSIVGCTFFIVVLLLPQSPYC